MSNKSPISKVLRALLSAIEALDPAELDALVAGKGKLLYSATEREHAPIRSNYDLHSVAERLSSSVDRDSARAILTTVATKEELVALARAMKVHIVKHDRRDDIERKIVEFAIGGRLRSEAIHALNLKGGGSNPGS
jgi:hypothetical protein